MTNLLTPPSVLFHPDHPKALTFARVALRKDDTTVYFVAHKWIDDQAVEQIAGVRFMPYDEEWIVWKNNLFGDESYAIEYLDVIILDGLTEESLKQSPYVKVGKLL